MNFYNPYIYSFPNESSASLLKKISFTSIINGASKTLNLVNQTIPIIKHSAPLIRNIKTMFTLINEFKKDTNETINNTELLKDEYTNNSNLKFFI